MAMSEKMIVLAGKISARAADFPGNWTVLQFTDIYHAMAHLVNLNNGLTDVAIFADSAEFATSDGASFIDYCHKRHFQCCTLGTEKKTIKRVLNFSNLRDFVSPNNNNNNFKLPNGFDKYNISKEEMDALLQD